MRASLYTASCGGSSGYAQAGYNLGRHLDGEVPDDAHPDEWCRALAAVDAFIDDDQELAAWVAATYPRIWRLVPRRRRLGFVDGVRRGRKYDHS